RSAGVVPRKPNSKRPKPTNLAFAAETSRCGMKWRLLLPGASEPRLPVLTRQDFRLVFQTALSGLSNRSIVVVCNYCMARYRRNHTGKKRALYALVDLVSPPPKPPFRQSGRLWWRRRVLPPGPNGLLRR